MQSAYYSHVYNILLIAFAVTGIYLVLNAHLKSLLGKNKTKSECVVVLAGLPGSGKTVLWQSLTTVAATLQETIPSRSPLKAAFRTTTGYGATMPTDPMRLGGDLYSHLSVMDTPGDWCSDVEKVMECSPRVVVFCIDSRNSQISEAASYLFEIMSTAAWQSAKPRPALCISLTFGDQASSKHKNIIRDNLEREIERLFRTAKASTAFHTVAVPYSTSLTGKVLDALGKRHLLMRWRQWKISSKAPLRLVASEERFFRFQNLDAPYFGLALEKTQRDQAEAVRACIQRASVMCQKNWVR